MVRTLIAVALVVVTLGGCDEVVTHFVDPDIRLSGQGGPGPDGDPEVAVGFAVGARFVPLDEDDGMRVINGLQGGTWTMPTVRTRGIGQFAAVVCTLETAATEVVAAVDAKVKFFPSSDGPLEVAGLPIPFRHADDPAAPVDDLDGVAATLDCAVSDDDGNRAAVRYGVVVEVIP